MVITFSSDLNTFSATLPDDTGIDEVMEVVTNMLLSLTYNYASVMEAHKGEAERMEEILNIKE